MGQSFGGFFQGPFERFSKQSDAKYAGRWAFNDAIRSDPNRDDLGLGNSQFTSDNDLDRLSNIQANEGFALDERLRTQIQGLQDVASRKGEGEAVEKSASQSEAASDRDAAQFERSTRGMGLSDRQRKSSTQRLGLRRSLNRATATGNTRRGFTDRADAAASMGGGFADALFGQRVAGETAIATASVKERAAADQARADKKSSQMGTAGGIVGGIISMFSSESYKDDRGHEPDLLKKLRKVRVNRWNYKGQDETHVGPFSEEFNEAFGINTDRTDMIGLIDAIGVTMGAVKELDAKVSANGR